MTGAAHGSFPGADGRRRRAAGWRVWGLLACAAIAPACGGSGASMVNACASPAASFAITDDTNYSFTDSISIEMSTLKDATDLTFDWGSVTTDFLGKPVDAANDIDVVLISLWHMTPDVIKDNIKHDMLPLGANVGVITTYPDGSYTSKNLLGFDLLGNPLPPADLWMRFDTSDPSFQYPQDQYTFLMMASTGTTLGKNARMLSLFNLDPSSTKTSLTMTNASAQLDFTANLTAARAIGVPAGVPGLTIDWSQMTVNALGNPYIHGQITLAAVAHYASKTLPELEQQFQNLQEIADGWWSGPVISGASIDLGTLVDGSGAAFPGVDTNGVWLAALFCTDNCNNPAPWSITVLEACN